MTWILALSGPALLGALTVLAQAATGGSSVAELLVAFGVVTGLAGAVAKLYAENQRLQKTTVETVERTLGPLGEAIAEMRETRRERAESTQFIVEATEVIGRATKALDRLERKLGR